MIDFPASPINGQVFVSGAQSWTFDGTKWVASGNAVMPPLATGDNRLVNGDMRIDQRNNGAAGSAVGYTVDRWQFTASLATKGAFARAAITSLPGFPYCLGFTSNSAYSVLAGDYFLFMQPIEADMISDFAFGTSNAQPVTLSFWANSTISGTFGGSLRNVAATRTYPFSYSLTANVWTKVVITIPGDTAGTWVMSGNAGGAAVVFGMGAGSTFSGPANAWAATNYMAPTGSVSIVGTNGAQFLVTGVKLEIGSVATPYNRQSLAKSMADCQRYYQTGLLYLSCYAGTAGGSTTVSAMLPVLPRTTPTMAIAANNCVNLSSVTLAAGAAGGGTFGSVYNGATSTAVGGVVVNINYTASAEL